MHTLVITSFSSFLLLPSLTDFFNRIDELCGTLQSTRGRLQQLWEEKGGKLDQVSSELV